MASTFEEFITTTFAHKPNSRFTTRIMLADMFFTRMISSSIKEFQILRSVIISNSVNMVNYFRRRKIPTNNLFHNQTVFQYIPRFMSIGVIWSFYFYIPIIIIGFTAMPSSIVFHLMRGFYYVFGGMFQTSILMSSNKSFLATTRQVGFRKRCVNYKLFASTRTFYCNHNLSIS